MKNTAVARVLPATTAITASPSRSRVVARSFTSFWRLIQPSRESSAMPSSSTMKSSAEYSTSASAAAKVVRRASLPIDGSAVRTASISSRTMRPARRLVAEGAAQLAGPLPRRGELLLDHLDLEPRQPVDLQLEDRVGLLGVEPEAGDDLPRRVGLALRLAHDPQDLVEGVEDLREAFEQVLPA